MNSIKMQILSNNYVKLNFPAIIAIAMWEKLYKFSNYEICSISKIFQNKTNIKKVFFIYLQSKLYIILNLDKFKNITIYFIIKG